MKRQNILSAIMAFLLIAGLVLVASVADATITNGSTNFDSGPAGLVPSGTFFTWTSGSDGSTVITNQQFDSSPNSIKMLSDGTTQSGGTGGAFNFGTVPLRDADNPSRPLNTLVISFNFRLGTPTAGPNPERFNVGSLFSAYFNWDGSAHYTMNAQTYSGVGNTYYTGPATPAIYAPNTWYSISFSHMLKCDGASSGLIVIAAGTASQSPQFPVTCTDPYTFTLQASPGAQSQGCSPCLASGPMFIDDLSISSDVVQTPGATNTVAVTALIGFDVDNFGNTVIARVGNGNAVKSFVGSSLALLNTVSTPNCNRQDGVAALLAPTTTAGNPTPHNAEFLTYIDCASGGASTSLIITDDHLNPPSQPAFCTQENSGTSTGGSAAHGPFCDSTIQANSCGLFCVTDNNIPLPTGLEALGVLNTARWDWSAANAAACTTSNVGGCRDGQQKYITMSWGYAGNNGKVGMFQVVQNRANPDSATAIEDTLTTTGSPLDICTWTDSATGRANIGGVASNVNTKAWIATPGVSQSATALTGPNFFQATPTLALETSFSNTFNSANSIDCIDGVGAIGNGGGVWVTYMNGPNQGLTLAGPISIIPNGRGVAITRDEGKFGRFVSISNSVGNGISIYNVSKTPPSLVASLTPPTGIYKQMKWDLSAQNLWVATDSNIAIYDVHLATTIVPIAEGIVVATNGTRTCVGADNLPSAGCDGVSDQSRNGLNGCGGVSQPACTSATNTVGIGTGGIGSSVAGLDVGNGIKAWAQSVGFQSDGSLFFFGLLLMAFGMVASGAAVGAFGGKQAAAVTASIVGLGVMIFNMLQAIWGLWTMAVMIVITAAILSVIVRRLYQPGVDSSSDGA